MLKRHRAGIVIFVMVGALVGAAGCVEGDVAIGSDGQALLMPGPGEAEPRGVCETFCAEAAEVGCPPTGDCMTLCAEQYGRAPDCASELDAWLSCAGTMLEPIDGASEVGACAMSRQPSQPAGEEEERQSACWERAYDYEVCLGDGERGTFALLARCGAPEASARTSGGEIRALDMPCRVGPGFDADLSVRCEPGGVCSCLVDGAVGQVCQNLIHTDILTMLGEGCCGDYFETLLDM